MTTSLRGVARASATIAVLLGFGACRSDQPTAPTAAAAAAQQRDAEAAITVSDLGPLAGGGTTGVAYGINDRGEVVGGGFTGGITGRFVGFVWTQNAGARPLSADDLDFSVANHINDRGDVVGGGCPGSNARCYALTWTAANELIQLPAVNVLHAINNRGQAVGAAGGAVEWTAWGGVRRLDRGSFPLDVNERGDAVGQDLGLHAALWPQGGALVLLPTPAGQEATATGVNNRGDVVGFVGPHFFSAGFVWSERDGLRMLETPSGWYSHPEAINNRGEIVGWILGGGADSEMHAVQWTTAGDLVQLPGLVPTAQSAAYDINNRGQIVGSSDVTAVPGVAHAVLWTVRDATGRGR